MEKWYGWVPILTSHVLAEEAVRYLQSKSQNSEDNHFIYNKKGYMEEIWNFLMNTDVRNNIQNILQPVDDDKIFHILDINDDVGEVKRLISLAVPPNGILHSICITDFQTGIMHTASNKIVCDASGLF